MKVVVSATARRHIEELIDWWNENRPDARVRVETIFGDTLAAIAKHPEQSQRHPKRPRYRSWLMQGTPYRVFFRIERETNTARVVAVWSMRRGEEPPLP